MPAPQYHVTLRDVARQAGVHTSTVSLGLRQDPRLRPATCERVQRVARELGYIPDPLLASLSSFRRTVRPIAYRATLAWITNHPTRDGWREHYLLPEFHAAAEETARAAGYRLDEFWMRSPGMTGQRAARILRSRGINGALVAPQPDDAVALDLDWSLLSSVVLGYTLGSSGLHVACNHQFRSMQLALQRLEQRDYRRIGFVLLQAYHERVDHNWLAGYLAMQASLPSARRLPALILPRWDPDETARWILEHRPDAIVTRHHEIRPVLERLGLETPRDIGVAFMNVADQSGRIAGIFEDIPRVGAGAVEWLIDLVRRNQRGVPAVPQRLMFDGAWVDGPTLRPAGRTRAARPFSTV